METEIHALKMLYKDGSFPANADHVSITATVPEGWRFVCWVQLSSVGWNGPVYPTRPDAITNDVYTSVITGNARAFQAFYLVSK